MDPSAPANLQQRTTLDLEVRSPARVRIGPADPMARGSDDQFVPFLVLSEHGNETSNFHGDMERAGKAGGQLQGEYFIQ